MQKITRGMLNEVIKTGNVLTVGYNCDPCELSEFNYKKCYNITDFDENIIVAIDFASDEELYARMFKEHGYTVKVFNEYAPKHGMAYNMFSYVKTADDISKISKIIVEHCFNNQEQYFPNNFERGLNVIAAYTYLKEKEFSWETVQNNMAHISTLPMDEIESSFENVIAAAEVDERENSIISLCKEYASFKETLSLSGEQNPLGTIYNHLWRTLRIINPEILSAVKSDVMHLEDMLTEKTAIIIKCKPIVEQGVEDIFAKVLCKQIIDMSSRFGILLHVYFNQLQMSAYELYHKSLSSNLYVRYSYNMSSLAGIITCLPNTFPDYMYNFATNYRLTEHDKLKYFIMKFNSVIIESDDRMSIDYLKMYGFDDDRIYSLALDDDRPAEIKEEK